MVDTEVEVEVEAVTTWDIVVEDIIAGEEEEVTAGEETSLEAVEVVTPRGDKTHPGPTSSGSHNSSSSNSTIILRDRPDGDHGVAAEEAAVEDRSSLMEDRLVLGLCPGFFSNELLCYYYFFCRWAVKEWEWPAAAVVPGATTCMEAEEEEEVKAR